MKKILLFLILLFIPFIVKAEDVNIKEVSLVDSSTDVVSLEPHYENLKINFGIQFKNLNDYAKYKVVIKNDSKIAYEIDNTTELSEKGYIKYDFSYDGNKIVKSGEEKEFFITATYIKEVPEDEYHNGKYEESSGIRIDLINGTSSSTEKNPYTASLPYILIILSIIALVLLIIAYKKKKELACLLLVILFIPLIVYALEKISIDVESYITIKEPGIHFELKHCDSGTSYYKYTEGMTWQDYLNSSYCTIGNDCGVENYHFNNPVDYIAYVQEEFDACVAEVPYPKIEHSILTSEEQAAYDAYLENYSRCWNLYVRRSELTDIIVNEDEPGQYREYCNK